MKRKRCGIALIIGGVVILLMALFISLEDYTRLIGGLLSYALLFIGMLLLLKNKVAAILINLLCIPAFYLIDYFHVSLFEKNPIFFIHKQVIDDSVIYNAVAYRVWNCNQNEFTFDLNYRHAYLCDPTSLPVIESNAFISSLEENVQKYKNDFVKISGRISSLTGLQNIEMQSYKTADKTLNGHVSFSDNVILNFAFSNESSLANFEVYDPITIIARVVKLEKKNNKYTLYLDSSKITSETGYHEYSLKTEELTNCNFDSSLYATTTEHTFYTSCIKKIYVDFTDMGIYDLNYALEAGKLEYEQLISRAEEQITKKENPAILYKLADFHILDCQDKENKVIIGNKSLDLDNSYCQISTPEEEESV